MSTFQIARSFVLPFLVLVVVPWAIHTSLEPLRFGAHHTFAIGLVFMLTGLAFLAWCNVLFVVYGEGTLAPWDPTKKLVILGPYRFVRNPMIGAVIVVLWGETLVFESFWILGWSVLFWCINHLYILQVEEPALSSKFGNVYSRYKQAVPRWIPLFQAVKFDP
jgi:protein-S-isoprenylcysteine O-methyltransferase Ste14